MMVLRQQLNEMVTTNNGRVSNTKVWASIGCAVSTWIMIYLTLKDKMTVEILFVYLCSVAGFSQLSKLVAYKYGGSTTTTTENVDGSTVTAVKCPDCTTKPKTDEGSD
jgi:hypothetical protein